MGKYKLYWVSTPSADENCFVAATTKRRAERHEECDSGFDNGDCDATLLCKLEDAWVEQYADVDDIKREAFYVQAGDVGQFGVDWRVVEGNDIFNYNGQEFFRMGGMNWVASFFPKPTNMVIRSVSDLLQIVRRDVPGDWVFRGHASCRWELQAGAHRLFDAVGGKGDSGPFERRMLGEFKRRARAFLPSPPQSDWEWLALAQHFGLPTRLLDWTENPLVALYFAVRENNAKCEDGMLLAYTHGVPEIDIQSSLDPFSIDRIEFLRPPHLDQRVISQRSVFTVEPPKMEEESDREGRADLRYWNVSGSQFDRIRDELALLGISESSLFPGLETLAAEIRREVGSKWDS